MTIRTCQSRSLSLMMRFTDQLLQRTTNQTLPEFVKAHIADGGDTHSMTAALLIATGQLYDRRTVANWIGRYS